MTFLSPIPAIIAAGLTIPALLILYFLKLRRRTVRVSSTIFWEDAVRDLQANVPWRWLRFSWLLILQLLALACLLLAFARPAINSTGSNAARLVLLIDRSASMSATDGVSDGETLTRLDQAKRRAKEILDRALSAGGGTSVAIIALAREPALINSLSSDRRALQAALDQITPTDQPGDLAAALKLCATILAGDGDESRPSTASEVILLSDGGFPQAGSQSYALAGASLRFERVGPVAHPDTPLDVDNLGIVAIAARRDDQEASLVRIFARVQNASSSARSIPVVLQLDGQPVQTRTIEVPATLAGAPPGQAVATFELRSISSGLVEVSIPRPDVLATDNRVAVWLTPPVKPRVLVVTRDSANADGLTDPSWVIGDVLRELPLRSLRVLPAAAYAASNPSRLEADLIIFDGVDPKPLPPIPSLSFGAAPGVDGLREVGECTGRSAILAWQRTHPVLRDVSLDTVLVDSSRDWDLTASISPGIELHELAQGRCGPVIVEINDGPVRRLAVAFEPARSTWPGTPSLAIFLASAVEYLPAHTPLEPGQASTTSQGASVLASTALETTYASPDATLYARARSPGVISLGIPERTGVYRLAANATGIDPPVIAVNLCDENESLVAAPASVRVSGQITTASIGQPSLREIWPWFVLAAGALLLAEWLIAAWWMRV